MNPVPPSNLPLEVGHVLFIDLIGYSKLLIEEQMERIGHLTAVVLATPQVRTATNEHMVRLPTGDGMALVFRNSAEEPVQCALEIARALKEQHPEMGVRMGVHCGPVTSVVDVDGRPNVVGAGINMAQRVMDCGEAGHILVSSRVAEDLQQYGHWRPLLHDIGGCEVKHGVRLHLFSVANEELGNRAVPQKLQAFAAQASGSPRWRRPAALVVAAVVVAGAAFALWQTMRPPTPDETLARGPRSIAVLMFDNIGGDPENAFFTEGVQGQILTHLNKVAGLTVISRSSVLHFKSGPDRDLRQIAQQLGVARLLIGSVERAANKIRVTAELIDPMQQTQLWAQSYVRDLADVFAIQSDIAGAIAQQLRVTLSPDEKASLEEWPTRNVAAFEEYSRAQSVLATGLAVSQERSFHQAVDLLNRAVELDPTFHAAYCQLVFVNGSLYSGGYDRTPSRLAAAEAALSRAAQLRPNAPETHLARGMHLYYVERNYSGALAELEIARRGLPHDARVLETTGYILRRQGRHEEGLQALERAVEVDPRNVFLLGQIVLSYQALRRYPEEAAVIRKVLEIKPDDAAVAATGAGLELLWRADTRPLQEFIAKLQKERPAAVPEVASDWLFYALAERDWPAAEQALTALGDDPFLNDWSIKLTRHFAEGLLARAQGDAARARRAFTTARAEQEKIVQQQADFAPAICVLALIDAGLGHKEEALAGGRRAMELLPVEKDPNVGQRLIAYFAMIAAWVGEQEVAVEHLERVAATPGGSTIAAYGMLKLMPFWDPLRGHPRFEQIMASLAPSAPAAR